MRQHAQLNCHPDRIAYRVEGTIRTEAIQPILSMSLAPSIPMFGSFFPAWLLCLLGAVVLTMILRGLFVVVGLDDVLRWKVAVYVSIMLIVNYIILSLVFNS